MTCLRRSALGALSVCALVTGALRAGAERGVSMRIHVRGGAQIEAIAWSESDGFVVRGSVLDDAGSPISRAPITIQPLSGGGPRPALPPAGPCARESPDLGETYRASADGYALETDDRGAFCLHGAGALGDARFRIRFQGGKLYDATESLVPLEGRQAALSPVLLRFDPAVDAIDLDRESAVVTVALRIDRSDPRRIVANPAIQREGLTIALEDERGAKLAEAVTGGDGRARLEIKTAALDRPGPGELRARFDGSAALAKSLASQPLVRRAQVALALEHPIAAARAEDGVPIDVVVTSSRGPVDGGVVEALRSGESVGAAAVADGKARVIAAFMSEREGHVPISLRYVPSTPWWRPGPELNVDVPIVGPGLVRQAALAALVLAIAGWVIGGWRRAPKPPEPPEREPKTAAPEGRPGVRILGPSAGSAGWRGVVTDAHDGTPIAAAELVIVVPTFDGTGIAARAVSDETGAFVLEGPHRSDARITVRSPAHSTYEQQLPPPSTLGIALVLRRRALLDRLVRWAKRQGFPFEGPPEPTPGHVRRVASRSQQQEVELWAGKVEHAAFGPDPVDERIEHELYAAEPKAGFVEARK